MRLHQQLVALAAAALFATPALAGLKTNYEHDGKTTYCWAIAQPPTNTKLVEADRLADNADANCPMHMTVTLSTPTPYTTENVTMKWTATVDFSQRNAVNMTKVVYGADVKGNMAHIVHSNIHTCEFNTGCDPFYDGVKLQTKTTNMIANFSDNFVSFEHSELFKTAGEYSVLAHIVLPDVNVSKRFDYAVYTKMVVSDPPVAVTPAVNATTAPISAPTPTATTTTGGGSSGLSTGALIGIIVAAVVLVVVIAAFVFRKRRREPSSPTQGYMAPPAYDASVQLLAVDDKKGAGNARTGLSDATDMTTSAGFQSAWSGPTIANAGGRPSQNLDGTGTSNVSGSSYASHDRGSHVSGPARSHGTAAGAASMYRDSSIASSATGSTATRPRRVDSDVEL